MAFCTTCGAQVTGAFCNKCGTPAAASSGPATPVSPPVAPSPMMAPPAAPMPAPVVRRGMSPLVWILIIIGGLFVLGIIGVIGTGFFVAHKMHQAGLDTDLMRRNPAAAIARMAAMANKDVEIVSEDDNLGTLTVRDRKSGRTTTMNFDQAKNGHFTFSAQDDNGKTATMTFGGGQAPSWVPAYPGATQQANITASGDGADGKGEGGNVTYTTNDSAARVMSFYQDKAKELGMKVNLTTTTGEGGMMVATDDSNHRSLTAIIGADGGKTTVNITYGTKK